VHRSGECPDGDRDRQGIWHQPEPRHSPGSGRIGGQAPWRALVWSRAQWGCSGNQPSASICPAAAGDVAPCRRPAAAWLTRVAGAQLHQLFRPQPGPGAMAASRRWCNGTTTSAAATVNCGSFLDAACQPGGGTAAAPSGAATAAPATAALRPRASGGGGCSGPRLSSRRSGSDRAHPPAPRWHRSRSPPSALGAARAGAGSAGVPVGISHGEFRRTRRPRAGPAPSTRARHHRRQTFQFRRCRCWDCPAPP
jgi:hypothetical protein